MKGSISKHSSIGMALYGFGILLFISGESRAMGWLAGCVFGTGIGWQQRGGSQ